ncbi:transcriptional antiterminator RfaH [Halopseudomonas xinjiangensis]|uniref:Transcriptional antiterminator RfaH n=1 Tax=Halopseudomonas xinjiangensis TaxID=487184 RepID=A0A1H1WDI2_9GAMM|nr:transcription/translation regulatory transformer protein RfaH [Halopseudomonas xinjiangensis]SDS94720.1 transcriptional antiterminator RfaH [Halopseudomonas xinjiangensis]
MNNQMELMDAAWYLLQCKPRQDARANEHLNRQGFECFHPTMQTESIRGGKMTTHSQALFPGYLFIRIPATANWTTLHSTRGVSRVVGFAGQPCKVADHLIEHLRRRCESIGTQVRFSPGDTVHIKVGPYAELDAIFVAMDGEERVMLLLNVLNRQQPVRVPLTHCRA